MSRICKNSVCNKGQGTAGCVSADWCPYFIADVQTVSSSGTQALPEDQWEANNRTIIVKEVGK